MYTVYIYYVYHVYIYMVLANPTQNVWRRTLVGAPGWSLWSSMYVYLCIKTQYKSV
jgi:hypothetical protein